MTKWYDPQLLHARERAEVERQATRLLAADRRRRRRQAEADVRRSADDAPAPVPASGKWLPLSELKRAIAQRRN